MKKALLLIGAILLSSLAFATGFSKDSAQLKALAGAWKSQASTATQKQDLINHHDITIVYAGQDLASKSDEAALAVA
jgi:hypothetical protein